ncbi:MAG: glycosyltransferase family 39 protein [Gammaproteobacteria bacterium]
MPYSKPETSKLAVVTTSLIGTLLILPGILVPSSTLIETLRATPMDPSGELLLGATLFKFGLVILGLVVIVIGRSLIWKSDIQGKDPPSDSRSHVIVALLTAIVVAAFALRLYRLDGGLWYDEIVTYVNYARIPFGKIITTYDDQNQHILYSLLAHASFQIFGDSAWSLRFPAVLFGIGSIWALYLLGREVSNTREALLAAALLAFSYHHVWFSQNARGYTALLFWTIVASWLFLRALREAKPRLWLLYAIAVAFGAYTLIYMLFVVIGHLVIYLITLFARRTEVWPNRWAGAFLGFCLAGFLTFQLYALVLPQFFTAFTKVEHVATIWTQPMWGFLEFVKGLQINFSGSLFAAAALLVFGTGFVSFMRTNPVVIGLLIIPALTCIAVKVGMGHDLWPRSLFFAMGFGALVVVRGAVEFGSGVARLVHLAPTKAVLVGSALCTGLVIISAMSIPFAYGPKQDYLGPLAFIEENKEPGDAIVIVGVAEFPYKNLYKVDWESVKTLDVLNTIRSRTKRTWLVHTFPIETQSVDQRILASIQHDFKEVKPFYGTLNGGTIFVYRSDTPPPSAFDQR